MIVYVHIRYTHIQYRFSYLYIPLSIHPFIQYIQSQRLRHGVSLQHNNVVENKRRRWWWRPWPEKPLVGQVIFHFFWAFWEVFLCWTSFLACLWWFVDNSINMYTSTPNKSGNVTAELQKVQVDWMVWRCFPFFFDGVAWFEPAGIFSRGCTVSIISGFLLGWDVMIFPGLQMEDVKNQKSPIAVAMVKFFRIPLFSWKIRLDYHRKVQIHWVVFFFEIGCFLFKRYGCINNQRCNIEGL